VGVLSPEPGALGVSPRLVNSDPSGALGRGVGSFGPASDLNPSWRRFFSVPDALNTITLRGVIGTSTPVLGFRPGRGPLVRTMNDPNEDSFTFSPRSRQSVISFKTCSTTRRGYDWTDRYPLIRKAVAAIRTASAVIDGEAVCCDDAGMAVFEKLHSRAYDDQVFLYAFDLLELDGEDWRSRPLEARKARLEKLITEAPAGIQYSQHLDGDGATIFAHACKLGLEGIVSKHREHPYRCGPSKAWLKIKNAAAPGVLRFQDRT
jgi:bifunctional non-homologous end joining protein LigD